jgi:hypothetical protein
LGNITSGIDMTRWLIQHKVFDMTLRWWHQIQWNCPDRQLKCWLNTVAESDT